MAVEVLLQPRTLPVACHDRRLASSSSIVGGAQARTLCLQNRLLRRATRSSVRCWATIPVPDSSPVISDLGWPVDFAQHYVKGKLVGQGSFGSVYLGIDLHTGKEVAVKVMPKQRGKLTKERTLQKLAKEVGILQKMQPCRNVVRLRGCFESNEEVMVVTDMCKGGDLQKLSDDHGALPERAVALIAYEVLQVVEKCHELGILHGDVKPANFVLADRTQNPLFSNDINLLFGKPWLLAIDFGCSQYLTHVRFSKRTGTPVYMAPEIFDRDYHWEADMWSLGIMLYQLYARRFPFWRTYEECRHAKLDEVAALVADSPMPFDYGPWRSMSMEGLDFMRRCLVRDYTQRMTVPQALNHPWLMQWLPETDSDSDSDALRLMSLDSLGTSDEEDVLLLPPRHSGGAAASPALQQQQRFEQQQVYEQQMRQQRQQHKVLVPPVQQQQQQVVLAPQQQKQLQQQQQQQQQVHAAGTSSYDPNQFPAGPGAYSSNSSTVGTGGGQQQQQQQHQQPSPVLQQQQQQQQQHHQQQAHDNVPQQQPSAAGANGGGGITNNIVPGSSNSRQQQQPQTSSAQPAEVNAAAAVGRRQGAGQQ